MSVRIVKIRAQELENIEECSTVLIISRCSVIALCLGIRIQKTLLIQFVIKLQAGKIRPVFFKRIMINLFFRIIQPEAKFIVAVICGSCRFHEHNHVAVPILKERHAVCRVSIVIGRAGFLHLCQYIHHIVKVLDFR